MCQIGKQLNCKTVPVSALIYITVISQLMHISTGCMHLHVCQGWQVTSLIQQQLNDCSSSSKLILSFMPEHLFKLFYIVNYW